MHVLPNAWFMWAIVVSFYFYQFILRASPNVLSDILMETYQVDAAVFGALAAAYYYTYAFLQIPLGYAMDLWGLKKVLRSTVFICALGALLFAMAPSFGLLFLGRLLIGVGAAAGFMGAIRIGALWFPKGYLGSIIGATSAVGKVGGLSAAIIFSWCLTCMHWRTAMGMMALVGFILGCILFLYLQDSPHQQAPHFSQKISLKDVIFIFKNKDLWRIGLYGCCMFTPLSVLADAWGISFLLTLHPWLSKAQASFIVSLLFIGGAVGGPLVAWCSDRLEKRIPVMVTSSLLTTFITGLLFLIRPTSIWLTSSLLFCTGLFMTGQTLVFASASERVPASQGGVASGLTNTLIMLSGVIFQPAVGFILTKLHGANAAHIPYTLFEYQCALGIIPIGTILALSFLVGLKESTNKRPIA